MKRVPPPCPEPVTGHQYWRSLDELADTPEFRAWVEREFPDGASELRDPVSRRHFVQIMSASFMLAGLGLTGCRRPVEKIEPFAKRPEGYVHGVPRYYATAMPAHGSAVPLVVKSNEGRPTKIEGNALHPDSNGSTDLFAQASILNLYDPDRVMRCTRGGHTVTREAAIDFLRQLGASQGSGGKGLCVLLEPSNSPSRARLIQQLRQRLPESRWFVDEPVNFDVHRAAATAAFGQDVTPYWKLDAAQVVVSLDCDFIGAEPNAQVHIRQFAAGRRLAKPTDPMNRLYAVEGLFSLTGAAADHRLRLAPGQVGALAAQLAARVVAATGGDLAGQAEALNRLGAGLPAGAVDPKWVEACASDLVAHRGTALVLAGYGQPLEVHLLAHMMNAALGAVGRTLILQKTPKRDEGSLVELAKALNAGEVETLLIVGGNPVYSAPGDLKWAEAQRKAKTVVCVGTHEDETSKASDWSLPLAHYLESWGDARTADGTLVPVQPLVEPLFGGFGELEIFGHLAGSTAKPYDFVRETFRGLGGAGDDAWGQFLHDGFLAGSAVPGVAASLDGAAVTKALAGFQAGPVPTAKSLEVVFRPDGKLEDGRYNNNGWLQELPDPITKLTWENVVLLSPRTADELGIRVEDKENLRLTVPLVKLSVNGREVVGPAWVQPGMADYVIGLSLGYGRAVTGRVGRGSGFDVNPLRTSAGPHLARGGTLSGTGGTHLLATVQNHWVMEGRPIIREANLDFYRANPKFAAGMSMPAPSAPGQPQALYANPLDVPDRQGVTPRERALHAWGMSIDLNACVGCGACMVACQSENNVPIVGKYLVSRSREMHWLRLDRYFAGPVENPQMVVQPMMCQHCEAAPCENVCPVNATVHDEEGLNVMAYNRCVGTRYCSNNCPYKVRRFNYLDYSKRPLDLLKGPFYTSPLVHSTDGEWDLVRWFKNPDRGLRPEDEWEVMKLGKNPDVTVRMRGVMEKCTFCVQRIEAAKITQKVKARGSDQVRLTGDPVQTACQQACPAEAIVFGDLKDPESRVSQLKARERDYSVLEFLLTKPRTTYMARVRNPNPAMPDHHAMPYSFQEWEQRGNHLNHGEDAGHAQPGTAGGEHASRQGGGH